MHSMRAEAWYSFLPFSVEADKKLEMKNSGVKLTSNPGLPSSGDQDWSLALGLGEGVGWR